MPTKVGIQRGHKGAEGIALTYIFVFPQMSLVVGDDKIHVIVI